MGTRTLSGRRGAGLTTTELVRGASYVLLQREFLPAVPPVLYLPSARGIAIPPKCIDWWLFIDQGGLSAVATYEFRVELCVDGTWPPPDSGADGFSTYGGSWQRPSGIASVNWFQGENGIVKFTPYPSAIRVSIRKSTGGYVPVMSLMVL